MDQEQTQARRVGMLDVAALAGVALITAGTAMMHVPSALIVCGALVLCGAVQAARRG